MKKLVEGSLIKCVEQSRKSSFYNNMENPVVNSQINTLQTNATEEVNNNEYANIKPIENSNKEVSINQTHNSNSKNKDSKDLKVIVEENSNLVSNESNRLDKKKNSSKIIGNLHLNQRLNSKISNKKVSIITDDCYEENDDLRKSNIISVRRLTEINHSEPKPKKYVISTKDQPHPHVVIPPNCKSTK